MSNSTSNYDYNQIVNPETNRTVNTNSRTGKKVLEKYKTLLNVSQQGGVNQIHARDWRNIYRTNAYKKNKISIRDKYGKEYVGLFLNGANILSKPFCARRKLIITGLLEGENN